MTTSTISVYLENILDECGGFSKFQLMMISAVIGSFIAPTWSMLMMIFAGAEPDWYCLYDLQNNTLERQSNATTVTSEIRSSRSYQQCHPPLNATTKSCISVQFDDNMETIVSEWDLVCDSDWISSTITTIQMAGILAGSLISGHMADYIGRKPMYFLSLLLMIIFNVCAGFSSSWQMFAVFRFLLGLGIGSSMLVFAILLIEFIPANRRAVIGALPAGSIWAAAFGFLSMWLHNWKYLHFATAICTAPWLLFWKLIPESFRFLVTHGRFEEAENVITKIALMNGCPVPDLNKLKFLEKEDTEFDMEKKYSIKHLLITPSLLKMTFLFSVGSMMCGFGYYAISFGVQSLSGSLYLNMFLLSVVELPGIIATYFLNNRIGRKKTSIGLFTLAGIAGIVVAAVQTTDWEMKNQLINGFAMAAKIGVAAGAQAQGLLAMESFPTVVRSICGSIQDSISRVGGMVAPQIVYLDHHVPGLMYFFFGGTMLLSAICTALVQETNNKPIEDVIKDRKNKSQNKVSRNTANEPFNRKSNMYVL